jgi:hypothetical protein
VSLQSSQTGLDWVFADSHTKEEDQGKIQCNERSIDRKDDQEATLLSCVVREDRYCSAP